MHLSILFCPQEDSFINSFLGGWIRFHSLVLVVVSQKNRVFFKLNFVFYIVVTGILVICVDFIRLKNAALVR